MTARSAVGALGAMAAGAATGPSVERAADPPEASPGHAVPGVAPGPELPDAPAGIDHDLWTLLPRAFYCGDNRVQLHRGGDALFPAMIAAIDGARRTIWLTTYIFSDDKGAMAVARALAAAAKRGVQVRVVLDGFGCNTTLPVLRPLLCDSGVMLTVFRPLTRWWNWLQPSQLRRLHQKLCTVDGEIGFVGGINLIDDRFEPNHGWFDAPRLDFAAEAHGPVVSPIEQAIRAVWTRAQLGRDLREEVAALTHQAEPLARARRLARRLRMPGGGSDLQLRPGPMPPVRAAFVLRDNLRQRRTIERSYIAAIHSAKTRLDLITPYFYPGRSFRRALRLAARRGVSVRLLLQGKIDYRIAGLAARALYGELISNGVRIFEYKAAFLHAKVAVVDDDWATVGSSNIDPMSLLLNLEANLVVRDAAFCTALAAEFDTAVAAADEVVLDKAAMRSVGGQLTRGFVAWGARLYLRVAGAPKRY